TLMTIERPEAALYRAYEGIAAYLAVHHGGAVPSGAELLHSVHNRLETRLEQHIRSGRLEELDLGSAAAAAFRDLGLELAPEHLDEVARREQEAWWEGILVAPGTAPTLQTLRERGVRTGLCSNAPYRSATLRAQLDHLGLGPLLDSTTFSGEVGWRKPSPAIFEAALRALGTSPRTTVMVGDSATADVGGARAVGMRTVRTLQYRDDRPPDGDADALIERIEDLPPLIAGWA
ncbi:MAG: HAD family hydrolase, partial [Candidatus Dormibacteria bacterium]